MVCIVCLLHESITVEGRQGMEEEVILKEKTIAEIALWLSTLNILTHVPSTYREVQALFIIQE